MTTSSKSKLVGVRAMRHYACKNKVKKYVTTGSYRLYVSFFFPLPSLSGMIRYWHHSWWNLPITLFVETVFVRTRILSWQSKNADEAAFAYLTWERWRKRLRSAGRELELISLGTLLHNNRLIRLHRTHNQALKWGYSTLCEVLNEDIQIGNG